MNVRNPQPLPLVHSRRARAGPLSPIESLAAAWHETLRLLFRPFHARRWIELSVVCLFLGGGTSTAAFHWGLSILPIDVPLSEMVLNLRTVISQHLSLIILAIVLGLGLALALLYVRCVLRFVLVEAVIKQEVEPGTSWKSVHALGRAYFFWLVGILGIVLVAASGGVMLSFRYLGPAPSSDHPSWLASLVLVIILIVVVLIGLSITVAITLTDDLVVPLIYAERGSFPAAWRKVWGVARHDPATFLFYVALRFTVSVGIGVVVLFLLFPVLMSLSSAAIVIAALVNLSLHVVGLAWNWNPLTMVLGVTAILLLIGLLFAILSLVGMPGQVYMQNYGVRFIASRYRALEALSPVAAGRRR